MVLYSIPEYVRPTVTVGWKGPLIFVVISPVLYRADSLWLWITRFRSASSLPALLRLVHACTTRRLHLLWPRAGNCKLSTGSTWVHCARKFQLEKGKTEIRQFERWKCSEQFAV